ncbi:MAG: pilus assembly protein PilM [Thermodesulfobacteriota bacterium]
MLFQASVGIDIQEDAIIIAYLKGSFKGAKLEAHGVYPFEEELSSRDRVERVGYVVKEFLVKNRIPSATLFLGIPREAAILRYVEFPLVVKENLRDSLRYELEKYVPFPPDELYFDYQIISEDKSADKLRLLLVMVKRELIDPYMSLEKTLGARLSGIEVSSTACANFFAAHFSVGEPDSYALIYTRKGGMEIDLLQSGFLAYSRPMDKAQWGEDFQHQVSQRLKKLKEEVKGPQALLKTVVWNMEREAPLLAHLKEAEGFEVHFFDPASAGVPSADAAPAYGLALKGLRELPTDVNLLPAKMRKKPSKVGYYGMFGLVGVVVFLALAWIGGSIFNTQRYVKQLDNELNRLNAEIANLEQIEVEYNRIEQRIDFLNPLRKDRLMVLNVIRGLSEQIPKNAWLLRLTYSDKDSKIQIEGWADSASDLIPALEDSPLFKNVGFLSSITRSSAGKERFRIGLELEK